MIKLITLPFVLVGKLLTFLLKLAGRIVLTAVGMAFLIAGVALCFTVVGLVAGLPLAVIGLLFLIRGLF